VRLAGDPVMASILQRAFGPTAPESCGEFLAILSGLSDDGTGGGGASSGRLTQPESDIRHADRASREIHAAHDAQSHNLNATLSTRSASDGSDA